MAEEPHIIRLRGPWETGPGLVHGLGGGLGRGIGERIRLPEDETPLSTLLGEDEAVPTWFYLGRTFNQPTGLDGKTVRLECLGWPDGTAALYNGRVSGMCPDITMRLAPHNQIVLAVPGEHLDQPAGTARLVISDATGDADATDAPIG